VLDDTTSALDPATEGLILDNLRGRSSTSTVLLIASRPSTIALADDVIFMTHGRVAAHGAHDVLLDTTAAYRELVEAFESDRDERPGSETVDAGVAADADNGLEARS
jgi:ATP-binding cassette subfamily B protein